MGFDVMIYIPSSVNIGSGTQKLSEKLKDIRKHRQLGDIIILLFQNIDSRLKTTEKL
jgi:hypothetical protein